MRRTNFIVGFNNWGKTYTIHTLFGRDPARRVVYRRGRTYPTNTITLPVEFIVQSQSNDDVGMRFIQDIIDREHRTRDRRPDLFAALCPALEHRHDIRRIFRNAIWNHFGEFNFFLLEYKWDAQAKLILDEVEKNITNLGIHSRCFRITRLNFGGKMTQLNDSLRSIYY